MAKLVKINEIYLYVGLTEHASDCFEAIKLLKAASINYTLLNYADQEDSHKANFEALSTWSFGAADSVYQKQFKQYPILTWKEYNDDWSSLHHAAQGIEEVKTAILTLTSSKDLIQ
jgi:hypothetical protein